MAEVGIMTLRSMHAVGYHGPGYHGAGYPEPSYNDAEYYPNTGSGYDYGSPEPTYTHASPFVGGQAGHLPTNMGMPSYLDKGKEVSYDSVPTTHSNSGFHNQAYTEDISPDTGPAIGTPGAPGNDYQGFYPNAGFGSAGVDDDGDYEEEDDGDEDGDEGEEDYDAQDMELAMEESRRAAYYGDNQAAGSSASASAYAPTGYDDMTPSVTDMSGAMGDLNLADQVGGESFMGVDPGSFGVVHSYQYQPGRVFKMFWSEPRGKQGNNKTTALPTGLPTENWNHDKNFYVGVRRFVIIATDRSHHSTCVPILTYEHRACTKPGVQPGTHGIIYSQGRQPMLLKGERDLGYRPVSCEMNPHETLVKESRVNYSKLTTIEHNVEVQFIGNISATDFEIVQHAVDDCWQKKKRHSTRESKPKSKPTKPSKPKPSKPSRPKPEAETKHKSSSSKTSSDRKHSRK
ncbi:Translation initiation factor RLI1 [Apiospora arundinis]